MRKIAPIAALVAVATFGFAPAAFAIECDGMQRSFSGELQKAKDEMIVVDNKKGDKIKFEKHDSTTVAGTKTAWEDLSKGDYVTVCSKMLEKPRYAYAVEASEPPEDF